MQPSITSLLLRDGTTYFCVLLAVNIVTAVLSAINPILEIADFCYVFTTILLSRFFLNLREVSLLPDTASTSPSFSGIRFADTLRTLGGSIAEHINDSEDVLDRTGELMCAVDEEGEYPAEITERSSLSSTPDKRVDTLQAQSMDPAMSRETNLNSVDVHS
ncbi:uncharacterized protein B0H18DRAFT_63204 [Fomitopsis serialis]|uniref:uncharacterized protein n=1 Tax=Fomitopsis serialis TaxID=139415 RepID=UPI002007FCDC|nr:uncharacterized protein B0H18DRAFT_63204 [Neoantrodia serialis]KAH9916639.1 hypothetical protein B0H18DRAFT_63204 [Neoantrodia serialis]